jgi:DNA-binding transcriptional LysR family regulator
LDYGRQILGINDEVWNRMAHEAFEGKLVIGVPPDILYPHIPRILKEFSDAFPRVDVKLISTRTAELKDEFAKGKLDLILTTESETAKGGEKLASYPLKWFCQRGNTQIWKKRPLPLAYEQRCIFRKHAIDSLDAENIHGISLLLRQAVLIASPISAPALQLSPFCREPSRKIGKKSPPVQAFPNYPNS